MSRMTTGKAIRFAITGALAASLLAGCASAGSKQLARAGEHAARSEAKAGRAVDTAEKAVALSPNDAAARVALGQAYLDAGRFQSAATTFGDAVELGDASGRTQLSLALAHIGAGDAHAAVAVLDEARDAIPATDRGLALALAGDTGRGVAILMDALRSGENTAKLRQNLAFAYALDGRWREARVAMSQDVPADKIDDRVGEWAQMSRPEDVQKRIATLLGVPAGIADAGQPQVLALGAAPQVEQLAAAEPVQAPAVPAAATAELPALDPSPVVAAALAQAPAAEPAPASTAFSAAFAAPAEPVAPVLAPSRDYISQPVVQAVPAHAFAAKGRVAGFTAQRAVAAPVAVSPIAATGNGTHLVQLGSFSSEANARRAVSVYTARNPELRGLNLTITPAVVRGKNFWRVAAAGLDGSSALRLCSGVKNRGGACFAYAATKMPASVAKPALALASAGTKARR